MSRVFARYGIFKRLFIRHRLPVESVDRARRWAMVADQHPELAEDIIIMGEIVALGDVDETNRLNSGPEQLAYERGRRDLALDLLAMMHLTPFELNQLLKESRHETQRPDQ